MWYDKLTENKSKKYLKGKFPSKFDLIISNFKNGDMVLFETGIVHWVLLGRKVDKALVKVFFEAYTRNDMPVDESGFVISDGRPKKARRKYEKYRKDNVPHDLELEFEPDMLNVREMNKHDAQHVVDTLETQGVIVVNIFKDTHNLALARDITKYLQYLLKFPKEVNLFDYKVTKAMKNTSTLRDVGLKVANVWENPNNSRSSIFPVAHGNTMMGAYSKLAKMLTTLITPIINPVFMLKFGNPVKISGIDFGFQPSVK